MAYSRLSAVSPLDGRYRDALKELSLFFSESALMKYRLKVEVEYLIALSKERSVKDLPKISPVDRVQLRKIYQNFNERGKKKVKKLEAVTNHDVKAIEYYIQEKINKKLHPWIHFALTSEDVNNLSYSLMWQEGLIQVYLPMLRSLNKDLKRFARRFRGVPMLSLTHGQPATPTSFGKEVAVFCARIGRQAGQIKNHKLLGKFGGATGTWSAHIAAYPKTNWLSFSSKFIKSLGLEPNLITTQIEPHDSAAESYHRLIRVNSILIDLCRDLWSYISRGIIQQKNVRQEVGSSTMPHKINPIQFENSEGNLGVSTALLNHLATKLPLSRMQRDLSDSTTLRNQGVALGYSYLALQNIIKGLSRVTINKKQLAKELDSHWEILSEAIQTVLRKNGNIDAYEKLKELTRGRSINAEHIAEIVSKLKISDEDKKTLRNLTPENYVGLAPKLVDLI